MAKTNFTKVEAALNAGLLKLSVKNLLKLTEDKKEASKEEKLEKKASKKLSKSVDQGAELDSKEQEKNEEIVKSERKKHINKRFNIKEKWLPLK